MVLKAVQVNNSILLCPINRMLQKPMWKVVLEIKV